MVFSGTTSGLDTYYRKHPPAAQTDLVAWIKNGMAAAIAAEPTTVGPPIDIIRITTNGTQRIQVKKNCPT